MLHKIFFVGGALIFLLNYFKYRLMLFPDITNINYTGNYKDIFVDGIHGWLIHPDKNIKKKNKVILYSHGNAGNIGNRQHLIPKFTNAGYSLLLFDYSGFGKSSGNLSMKNMYKNANSFVQYLLEQNFTKDQIILFGESIGCSVAINTAIQNDIKYVICQSGPASINHMIDKISPYLKPLKILTKNDFNTLKLLKQKNNQKILWLHSKSDEIIPYKQAEQLAPFVTEFVEIHGTHNNPLYSIGTIDDFIINK